jgi:RHS repeat-associated protein
MAITKGLKMNIWKTCIFLLGFLSISSIAATVRYQHTDMLGSVVSESDAAGNIISRSYYEPFGKRIGGDKEGIGYTGHLQDKDLGLTYMQARYFDPLIGRFYSNDPLAFRDVHSFNRYAYGNNNPYKYTDPDGKAAESWLNRPSGVSIQQNQDAYTGAAAIGAAVWTAGAASVSFTASASITALEVTAVATSDGPPVKITSPYKRPNNATTSAQRASVQNKPCVDCGVTTTKQVADHKTPLVKEYYSTGTIDTKQMKSLDAVQPQCPTCSSKQGAEMSKFSKEMKKEHELK